MPERRTQKYEHKAETFAWNKRFERYAKTSASLRTQDIKPKRLLRVNYLNVTPKPLQA